jgi:16S rRNA (guanine527-N7)-methyltransferase
VRTDEAGLKQGLDLLNLEVNDHQQDSLLTHLSLLRKWNRTYNLVAPGDLGHLLTRHLLDSLAIQPFLAAGSLLDVGAGAGFPGLPLAIINPDYGVCLVDSGGKKVRFLRHVARHLRLENVEAVHERIESFSPGHEFSTITSRAFASLRHFAESVRHLTRPNTRLLAMKGRWPAEELDDLPDWIGTPVVHRLDVPGLDAERHIVTMSPVT